MLSFADANGMTATFDVWMCDKNQAASCKEDLVTTEYVETRYSRDLRHLITAEIQQHPQIRWVSAHKKNWTEDGNNYIGN
jgi:hypothetical protein